MDLILPQKIDMNSEYLLNLSKQVDILNKMALMDRRGSLTQQFSYTLQEQFKELAQLMAVYGEDTIMKDTAVLKCKSNLEFYVWEVSNLLLAGVSEELAEIMGYLKKSMAEHVCSLERVVFRQKIAKAEVLDGEKDRIIGNLRRDLGVKRQYMLDLEERVREVEDENSKLYSKIITNAKNKVDFFNKSPHKTNQFRSTSTDKTTSPRKKILTRSLEDQINEILESKWKIQSINDRRASLNDYLHTYFTMKYGKPMSGQQEAGFRDNISYLAKQQDKHTFILFQSVLDEQCDENFIQEERVFLDKVLKYIKRHINQKYSRPHNEIEKIFESKQLQQKNDFYLTESDIEFLLKNIYRSSEVRTLQMILSELASSRTYDLNNKISCKRFINELLDYQLKKHLMRVEDIVREVNRIPERVQFLSVEHIQKIAMKTIHDRERCQILLRDLHEDRKWTVSEVIEIIERARHMRIRREL